MRYPQKILLLELLRQGPLPMWLVHYNNATNMTFKLVVSPEFVTGSSRMKAGTAQKLILNMISTTAMIQLGKVEGNKMVDMQLSNNKLVHRGTKMIMDEL